MSLFGSHPLLCTLRLSDSSCSPGSSHRWDCRSKGRTPDHTHLHPGRCPPLEVNQGHLKNSTPPPPSDITEEILQQEVKAQAVTHPRTGTLPPAPCHVGTRRWIPSAGLCSDGSSLRCWPYTHSDLQTAATTAQPHSEVKIQPLIPAFQQHREFSKMASQEIIYTLKKNKTKNKVWMVNYWHSQ